MTTLLEVYRARVSRGDLNADPGQEAVVTRMQAIDDALAERRKPLLKGRPYVRGLYLWGGVGRGKSMLMDLFFAHTAVARKRRVHFHAFMLELHDFMHRRRAARAKSDRIDSDLLAFAVHVAAEARLLCFDEFFVRDVADAMILGRLFTALFDKGVTVVATSNIAPDDLYRDGLQRDLFLPFIALLKERTQIVHVDGLRDYRLDRVRGRHSYFWPADQDAARAIDDIFAQLTDGKQPEKVVHYFKGRALAVPRAAHGVARFSFDDLCGSDTSALDFGELAARYKTVVVEGIPKLDDEKRNETIRFITLIDTLYENRLFLVASAAAPPERLYAGRESAGAFARTASRLMEMQSRDWREKTG